jgi:hypothetical protein
VFLFHKEFALDLQIQNEIPLAAATTAGIGLKTTRLLAIEHVEIIITGRARPNSTWH